MTRYHNRTDELRSRRAQRNAMPTAEVLLWSKLKGRRLAGYKFRRQFSVGAYVLDFFSPALKLAIELDGESHYRLEAQEYDQRRDEFLASLKIRTVRIPNDEVYENLEGVWEAMRKAASEQEAQGIVRPERCQRRSREGATHDVAAQQTHDPVLPPLARGGQGGSAPDAPLHEQPPPAPDRFVAQDPRSAPRDPPRPPLTKGGRKGDRA